MIGRRRDDETEPHLYEPGDYGRWAGIWWGRPPEPSRELYANLSGHEVVEHEDRTITVSPSILVHLPAVDSLPDKQLWHGYLERGVWRTC